MIQTIGKLTLFVTVCVMPDSVTAEYETLQLELNMGHSLVSTPLHPVSAVVTSDGRNKNLLDDVYDTFVPYNEMFSTEKCTTNFLKKSLWCELSKDPFKFLRKGR